MSADSIRSWVAEHQVLTAIAVVILLVGAFFSLFLRPLATPIGSRMAMEQDAAYDLTSNLKTSAGGDSSSTEAGGEAYVEVKEGNIKIKTNNAQRDADQIRQTLSNYQGYVEESRKYGSDLYTNINLRVRVPASSDNFERLLQELRQDYDVESYNVKNYRLSTEREWDELSILNKTIADYEEIRREANSMDLTEEKLDLLMQVTDKELEIMRKKKEYARDLSGKQRRSDFATLNIELREKKAVDIGPENIGNRFKNKVKDMLDSIVTILIDTVTFGVTLFFRVIQLIVYLIIIVIPLALIYKLGKKVYDRYY